MRMDVFDSNVVNISVTALEWGVSEWFFSHTATFGGRFFCKKNVPSREFFV